jgi:lambda repressor-like predicted transcriptional regulator
MNERTANKRLDEILRKLDILAVIQLAKSGLTLKETSRVLGVSEDTIERMLPFKKLKPKRHEE